MKAIQRTILKGMASASKQAAVKAAGAASADQHVSEIILLHFVQGFFTNRAGCMVYFLYRTAPVEKTDAAEISADAPTVAS